MPGAVYRNSSSGRKDRSDKRDEHKDERLMRLGKAEHPSNVRLASREADAARLISEPIKPEAGSHTHHGKSEGVIPSDPSAEKKTKTPSDRHQSSENGPRSWSLRLTPSILLMLGILQLVTLCFFFLFGLIIGRGSVPPSQPPELERLTTGRATSPEAPERILPEEDLRFMTSLKTDNPAEAAGPVAQPAAGARPSASPRPATGPAAQSGQTGNQVSQAMPSENAPAEIRPDSAKYDFVLRAAAFKSEEKADDLRERLEGSGIRTRLVREKAQKGTWYYVQILYRGTNEGLQKLRDSLSKFAIKDSIIASKKPVN